MRLRSLLLRVLNTTSDLSLELSNATLEFIVLLRVLNATSDLSLELSNATSEFIAEASELMVYTIRSDGVKVLDATSKFIAQATQSDGGFYRLVCLIV